MFKKITSLFAGGVLILSLAACGDSNADKEEVETTDIPKKEEVEKEATSKEEPAEEVEKKSSNKQLTVADFIKSALPEVTDGDLELSDTSYNFITNHISIFPANTDEGLAEMKTLTDGMIDIRHLNKNVAPHYEKVITGEGVVIDVEEGEVDIIGTASVIHTYDDDMNSYVIILPESSGDILEDDIVKFWGTPLGKFSFENVSGGHTNAQMLIGSKVNKIQ